MNEMLTDLGSDIFPSLFFHILLLGPVTNSLLIDSLHMLSRYVHSEKCFAIVPYFLSILPNISRGEIAFLEGICAPLNQYAVLTVRAEERRSTNQTCQSKKLLFFFLATNF